MELATIEGGKSVDNTYQRAFMQRMNQLHKNEEFTDVTLQSGDMQIPCHRNVLSAASDYFKALFSSGFKECTSTTVQMTMESDTLTNVVDYIYTGEFQLNVDNVKGMTEACDFLHLDTLKSACEQFMLQLVTPDNCVEFYQFAALYRLVDLQQNAKEVILSEFGTVAFMDEFKQLSCTDLIDFIRDNGVNVECEDIVFESVLGWVRHDLDNRKSSLEAILEQVRLPYCSRSYLRYVKDKVNMLTAKCFEYLHEAMAFQADSVHQHEISSPRTVPRNSFPVKYRILVIGGRSDELHEEISCTCYNSATGYWNELYEMRLNFGQQSLGKWYSVCRVEGGILLTGGSSVNAGSSCWLYIFANKKWEAMPSLNTPRYKHGSVSLGDCAYVVGGKGAGTKPLASVECLNLKRRRWSSLPGLPQAVYFPMVVTYANKIVVIGGRDAPDSDCCCVYVFDITNNLWCRKADTPEVCSLAAAVTLNDCIYVLGGENRTCLKYDPALDGWTSLSRPRHAHGIAPAVLLRGSILVAGGAVKWDDKGCGQTSSVIEKYDVITDTWCILKLALPNPLFCHAMFNVDFYDADRLVHNASLFGGQASTVAGGFSFGVTIAKM